MLLTSILFAATDLIANTGAGIRCTGSGGVNRPEARLRGGPGRHGAVDGKNRVPGAGRRTLLLVAVHGQGRPRGAGHRCCGAGQGCSGAGRRRDSTQLHRPRRQVRVDSSLVPLVKQNTMFALDALQSLPIYAVHAFLWWQIVHGVFQVERRLCCQRCCRLCICLFQRALRLWPKTLCMFLEVLFCLDVACASAHVRDSSCMHALI